MPARVSGKLTWLRYLLALGAASILSAATPDLVQARKLYSYQLRRFPEDPAADDGEGWRCLPAYQPELQAGRFEEAEALEKPIAAEPGIRILPLAGPRSWPARRDVGPFTAPGYASRRARISKSVELDGKNLEACSDLFEYYLEAPGFLGGGMDKATKMAERIAALNEIEGYWARAKIAEKRKEFSGAEQHLRRAVELAPAQAGRLLDLAKFLAKQGRFQESDQAFQAAEKVEPNSPKVMFAKADTYIRNGRNLDTARKLLRQYLTAALTPDDPPRAQAEKLLKQAGS
jgi:tetratricopeptide (TPR) repeat protein